MLQIPTRTVDQVDDFFGTKVADPYRWMENTDDPEVSAWLRAQASRTRAYLDALPALAGITRQLGALIRLPTSGLPQHRGARWFRTRNDGHEQQAVLVVSDQPFGAERILIDPNLLAADGSIALAQAVPDRSGGLIAFSYTEAGSDWKTWRVLDVDSGAERTDVVRWSKFCSPCWLPEATGFLYTAFDAPDGDEFTSRNAAERVQLHRLGTDQAEDEVVLALPDEPEVNFWPEITEDGRWLVIHANRGTEYETRVWVRDLTVPDGSLRPLIPEADAAWSLIGSSGTSLLMLTDRDAPLGRIVALDAKSGAVTELVAELSDTLESGTVAGGRLVLSWLRDASSRLTLHRLDGAEIGEVTLPGLGTVVGLEAREDDSLLHVGFTSFGTPPGVLAVDVESGEVSTAFSPAGVPSADLVVEQVRVISKDGTEIPVFLLHRSDVHAENGPHPAWLYGYGGFRIPMTPTFEPTRFSFAVAGGVVAVACLRGGGEYGAAWHDAGRLASKQNVFDDAVAVAEHLVHSGWTSTAGLAASGRSNGGLLVGALLTQRADLFACVVPEVGVLDMLRFPKWTIGQAWVSDYGDPYADAEQFATLYAYSPLHRLCPDAGYPPVLVLTSDHDDRVVPAHSVKFAARLQAVVDEDAVALLRVAAAGGHGHGRAQDALVTERADVLAFIAAHTRLPADAFA